MKFSKRIEVSLDMSEEMAIVRKWCKTQSEAVKILLEPPTKFTGDCPFPESCNAFPCKTLCCNADCCSNGNAYRMS